jgi:methyl-accepting chemotaxis protein
VSTASTIGSLRNSYVTKFGAGLLLLMLFGSMAGVNAYVDIAGQLTAAQRAELLSGILTTLLSFFVALAFVAATLGRETLDALKILTERAREMERGDLDVEVDTNRSDELGELYQSFAAMRDALRARIRQTEQQNRELQRRTEEYTEVMRGIADGDLSRRMNEDVEVEVMAELATEFNEMMDDLEATVVQVQRFTDAVSMASNDLATQTEHAMEASKQVGDAAAAVTHGADADPVPTEALTDGADLSEADVDLAVADGDRPAAGPALPSSVDPSETVDSIEALSDRMDRIDEVTELIARIATETNMLALNAGIEASKVEEGTEGFEVVAQEVKSLAEETRESAGEIEDIADEVRSGTSEAITSILHQQAALLILMSRQAEDLSEAANELQDLLEGINASGGGGTDLNASVTAVPDVDAQGDD